MMKRAYDKEIKTGKAPKSIRTLEGGPVALIEHMSDLRGPEAESAAQCVLSSSDPIGSFQNAIKDLDDKEVRYLLASYDHAYFGKTYLPKHFTKNFSLTHHPDAFSILRDLETRKTKKPFIMEGGRELGKSSCCGLLQPVRFVVVPYFEYLPDGTILDLGKSYFIFVGANLENIKESMGNACQEFEDNELIIQDFGCFYRDPERTKDRLAGRKAAWSKEVVETTNGKRFRAFAKHGSIRSVKWREHRPQYVYAEDLDKTKEMKSTFLPSEDVKWFLKDLLPAMDSDNYAVVITGNDINDNSFIHKISEHGRDNDWTVRNYKLYWDDEKTGERHYLWPEYYGPEYVAEKIGLIGSPGVAQEYAGIRPVDANSITMEDVHFRKPTDITPERFKGMLKFGGMDPAHKDLETSDYTVIQNIAYDVASATTYVLPAFRGQIKESAKIDKIIELYATWGWVRFGIEDAAWQYAIKESLEEKLKKMGVTMAHDVFVGLTQTTNKKIRVSRLFTPIKSGQIVFLEGNEEHLVTVNELIHLDTTQHDDACFVAGTLISTERGEVPIEQVTCSDRVLTRSGYARVLSSECTGIRKVISVTARNGAVLTGTPNHPVFDGNNFIPMGLAKELWTCESLKCVKNQSSSCTKVAHSGDTQTQNNSPTGDITHPMRLIEDGELAHCTKRSGRTLTELFQRAKQSIISTRTHSIIPSKTLRALHTLNTQKRTERIEWPTLKRQKLKQRWLLCLKKLLNGTHQKKELSGTKNTERLRGLDEKHMPLNVLNVAEDMTHHFQPELNFAAQCAGSAFTLTGMEKTQKRRLPARIAETRSTHFMLIGKPTQLDSAQVNVSQPADGKRVSITTCEELPCFAPVFNIRVDAHHEYFANGFLVHNCDALELAIRAKDEYMREMFGKQRGARASVVTVKANGNGVIKRGNKVVYSKSTEPSSNPRDPDYQERN